MRPQAIGTIVALAAAISLLGCSPADEASAGASAPSAAPSATTAAAAATPAPGATPVPGFEDWQLINAGAVRLSVDGATLVLDLVGSVAWSDDAQGVLFSRQVTGDFRASATVRTSKASDAAAPPGQDGTLQLAGLMARAEGSSESSVFIATGSIGSSTGLDTTTTEDGHSIRIQRGLPTRGDAELRLCRIGSTFLLWWRHVDSNEAWTHMSTLDRRDMPTSLQVGAVMSTDGLPDFVARFENLEIEPIPVGGGC